MMVASILGLLVAVVMIVGARMKNLSHWAYSSALITLPLIYMAFGAYVGDISLILKELMYGLPFIVVGVLCLCFGFKASGYLVAAFWLAHGAYDMCHELLFVNEGVPGWYPVFCAVVDIVVAGYLFYSVSKLPDFNIKSAKINA